jgi:hypothetical protein
MKPISDCGEDGCGECDVCRYLNHLEYAAACGPPGETTVERNAAIEAHLDATAPHWRS